jgi:hypothetical protein
MESLTSPLNGQAQASSPSASSVEFLSPQDFFPLSSHFHFRRGIRSSASRRPGAPLALSVPTAHTLATETPKNRSSIHSESREYSSVTVASTTSGSFSRARKRRHNGAENPEGSEITKRRRTGRSPPKKRSGSLKKPLTSSLKAPPPSAKKSSEDEHGDKKPAAKADTLENCCICMCDVEPDDLSRINGCEHSFCFGCIEKWAERENTCPLCKYRFTKIDRVNKKRKKGAKNSKNVRQRDQRSDLLPGAAIEGLLGKSVLLCKSVMPLPHCCITRLICRPIVLSTNSESFRH